MKDIEKKVDDICEIKDMIMPCLKASLGNGVMNADTKEVGEVIDMIKDLADSERSLWEAHYYKTVIEAMENPENERMGYTMPSAKSFKPMVDQEPYVNNYINGRHGRNDYGIDYQEYKDAKRHYTETGSPADKSVMDARAKSHMEQVIYTISDIWNDASPELKQKMKSDLMRLMDSMD